MKQKIFLLTAFSLLVILSFGQKLNLNGYKYIFVEQLQYQSGIDVHGIVQLVKKEFVNKGFTIVERNDQIPEIREITDNPCLLLRTIITHTANTSPTIMWGKNTVTVTIRNCKNEIVYSGEGKCGAADYKFSTELRKGAENSLKDFNKIKYSFNSASTPEITYPTVEKTNETEESIKQYLDNNKLDPIEGIYKSYQSDQMSYYKFGIVKSGDKFKAIILESTLKQWKSGEVKAYYEPSSMRGFYSVKWYMADKVQTETFASMENDAIMSIEFKDIINNVKKQDKFIKMYPAATGSLNVKTDKSKASGSGFFVSTNGIVATNAHVIEGGNKIEIIVSNELGTFTYKAKALLNDSKNDVALIQIDDDNFKGLSSIPYSLIERTDIGEKAFTIGYPLNDIMGTNYKVTDGIISSKSGIADDVRYFQITVPIQPGNSGGPLFNKDGNVIGITSAKLNSKAVGTQIENVNYAIKITYLLNLYNMLPNPNKLPVSQTLAGKELQEQIKTLKNFVCLIKIY